MKVYREFLMLRRNDGRVNETSLGAAYGSCLEMSDAMPWVHVTEQECQVALFKTNVVTD